MGTRQAICERAITRDSMGPLTSDCPFGHGSILAQSTMTETVVASLEYDIRLHAGANSMANYPVSAIAAHGGDDMVLCAPQKAEPLTPITVP